jgi:hypothetical protein
VAEPSTHGAEMLLEFMSRDIAKMSKQHDTISKMGFKVSMRNKKQPGTGILQ